MNIIHLFPEEKKVIDGAITISTIIEYEDKKQHKLWYKVAEEYTNIITDNCDPFVLGTIFLAMEKKSKLIVHGEVSKSLIENLQEFQLAWNCWKPHQYYPVEIEAEIITDTTINYNNKAIAAFSGGVDSCFNLWKNHYDQQYQLEAGLMVHGFDIPLTQKYMFEKAMQKSKLILDDLGLKLIPIATNLRDLNLDWEDIFGAAVVASLMLFKTEYNIGLIGSSLPYNGLKLPWGSNPITDVLLSSNSFKVLHYGAAYSRIEKIKFISNWSSACDNLRVCWQGENLDRNCGKCEKCIRTMLAFRTLTNQLPPCFEQDISDDEILKIYKLNQAQIIELKLILSEAKKNNISASWVSALEKCIINNERFLFLKGVQQKIIRKFPQIEKLPKNISLTINRLINSKK